MHRSRFLRVTTLLIVVAVITSARAFAQAEEIEPRIIGERGTTLVGFAGFVDKFYSSEEVLPVNYTAQVDVARFITGHFVVRGKEYPDWGAPKIREKLRGRCGPLRCPAISTVHAVLDRHGLVQRRGRRSPISPAAIC